MSHRVCLAQRWRSLLGLSIAGGMVFWLRFLDPGSVPWLSGAYTSYWGFCAVASLASIALALQETNALARQAR
jgi:hypothetical protein